MKPPPRPAVGRPAVYDDEKHKRLVQAATEGMFRRAQAGFAGVSLSALEEWIADGEKNPDGPYGQLTEDLKRAEFQSLWESLVAVRSGRRNWQAHAWYCERKYPSEYGRQIREHVGKDGGPLEFVVTWPKSDTRAEDDEPPSDPPTP